VVYRVLWQEYGVKLLNDNDLGELLEAVKVSSAIGRHESAKLAKLKSQK
jgi:hypothetical protein